MKDQWFPKLIKKRDQLDPADFKDAVGVCRECFEVTLVVKPCCGGEVEFNSIIFRPEDFKQQD